MLRCIGVPIRAIHWLRDASALPPVSKSDAMQVPRHPDELTVVNKKLYRWSGSTFQKVQVSSPEDEVAVTNDLSRKQRTDKMRRAVQSVVVLFWHLLRVRRLPPH